MSLQQGVIALPARVEAVTAFPRPRTVKRLQEFLGMVNFYNRFIPLVTHLRSPCNEEMSWSPERGQAFEDAKAALANTALLAHPSAAAPVALTTEASDFAVGAVCEQWVGRAWRRLAFFSRKLKGNERRYSTFDRELLVLFLATRHFRFQLEGREFMAFVHHKQLTFAMARAACQRFRSFQQTFDM